MQYVDDFQTLDECVQSALDSVTFTQNAYMKALADNTMTKDDFIETQIQFLFAVTFFSRPMAVVAAKIPSSALRKNIVLNVFEEHGEGKDEAFHENTFIEFLRRLGVDEEEINKRSLWSEVRAFNTALTGVSIMDHYYVSVSVFGMIERMFSEFSAIIGSAVVDNGWLKQEQLIHYILHAELDIKHADDFFDVLRDSWEEDQKNRYFISQGLYLGAHIFNQLYESLYLNRQKRLLKLYKGSHTLPDI